METSVLPMGFSFTCKEQVAMAMIGGCRRNDMNKNLIALNRPCFPFLLLAVSQVYTNDNLLVVLLCSLCLRTLSLPNSYLRVLMS